MIIPRARLLVLLTAILALGACNTAQISTLYERSWPISAAGDPGTRATAPRDLFVTIDGTSSTPVARTNAARLFEIIDDASRMRPDGRGLATYYAEGVGSNGNPLGLAAGLGMADDVRNAYEFLTIHYRPGDRIFLSGFSRGAYTARVVGGLIAVAGIPDLSHLSRKQRRRIVDDIFDAFKTGRAKGEDRLAHFARRIARVREVHARHSIAERGMENATRITAMALWDTVEALGTPDGTDDPREEVPYFLLTNCNVDTVLHALALDDNRAQNFTPIFADAAHLWELCEGERDDSRIEEVWFAGSHSDTSGSYATDVGIIDHLRGVSLNWMLEALEQRRYGLFPDGQRTFEDPFGAIHDARAGNSVYKLFDLHYRRPMAYQRLARLNPAEGTAQPIAGKPAEPPPTDLRPRIHASALARLSVAKALDQAFPDCTGSHDPRRPYKLLCSRDLANVGLIAELREAGCLDEDARGFRLRPGQSCVRIVGDPPANWPALP